MIGEKTGSQFVRFVIVGIFSTIVNYSLFYVLHTYTQTGYILASALGFIAGVFAGFLLNKNWTFSSGASSRKYIVKYFIVYTLSLLVSLVFLNITVEKFRLDAQIANVLCIGITTVMNFIGTKLIVFRA